jgi:hypothetical protein
LSVTIGVLAVVTWEILDNDCIIAADAIQSFATCKLGYNPQTKKSFSNQKLESANEK